MADPIDVNYMVVEGLFSQKQIALPEKLDLGKPSTTVSFQLIRIVKGKASDKYKDKQHAEIMNYKSNRGHS